MKKYFFIGFGGFWGAIGRHLIQSIQIMEYHGSIPLNTLIVNLSGSFLLSLILTLTLEVRAVDPNIKLGITTGFLGAFTTFSTFCKETVSLLQSGNYVSAISYMIISTVFGLLLAYLGILLAGKIGFNLQKEKQDVF